MKNVQILVVGLLLVLLAGCSSQPAGAPGADSTPPLGAGDDEGSPAQDTGEMHSSDQHDEKSFTLTAKKWEFSPSTLTVNEGDIVTLTVQSLDVTHGMALPAFGVNLILTPGDTKTATFTADKKGTYSFTCSVPCGTGHKDMRGTLVVQ